MTIAQNVLAHTFLPRFNPWHHKMEHLCLHLMLSVLEIIEIYNHSMIGSRLLTQETTSQRHHPHCPPQNQRRVIQVWGCWTRSIQNNNCTLYSPVVFHTNVCPHRDVRTSCYHDYVIFPHPTGDEGKMAWYRGLTFGFQVRPKVKPWHSRMCSQP